MKNINLNHLFGIWATTGHAAETTKTKMGFHVPKGSPLSFQLDPIEGVISVFERRHLHCQTGIESRQMMEGGRWNISIIEFVTDPLRNYRESV